MSTDPAGSGAGTAMAERPGGPSPIRLRFGRRKFDRQPTQHSAVLIASIGRAFPDRAIARALHLAGGEPVAVVDIARIYGSSLGLANPGLMPSRREMTTYKEHVAEAIAAIERGGVEAWGQVAATRRYAKTIAQAAVARGVDHVLVVTAEVPRWRLFIEGDTARDVKRRIGNNIAVEGIAV